MFWEFIQSVMTMRPDKDWIIQESLIEKMLKPGYKECAWEDHMPGLLCVVNEFPRERILELQQNIECISLTTVLNLYLLISHLIFMDH